MRVWYNNVLDDERRVAEVPGQRFRVGRDPGNDLVLDSHFIAPEAVVLTRRGSAWEIQSLGLNGVQLGDHLIAAGDRYLIEGGLTLKIFPFTLAVGSPEPARIESDQAGRALDDEISRLISRVHLDLLERMNLRVQAVNLEIEGDAALLKLERNIEELAGARGLLEPDRSALVARAAGHGVRGGLLNELISSSDGPRVPTWIEGGHWSRLVSAASEREEELAAKIRSIAAALKLGEAGDLGGQIERLDREFWPYWESITPARVSESFLNYLAARVVKKEVKDILFGYGPLEDLLRTPTISEIMVVDRERIFVEKNGVLENSGRRFVSDEVTQAIIERIVARVGRRIDRSRPMVDARMPDGSRVNAVIPPLAVRGPCLTIRKFPSRRLQVEDLIAQGSLTLTVSEFLRASVVLRKNVLISGGTGSGKTTLLNCLSNFIPDKERIVVIEDTAELQLMKEHVVVLETKEANIEGAGAYTIRDLVKNALRMRPDRIVVGECRGPEALDMLQAMNTGHDGSMTTIHANTAGDVIRRLEVLVQMAADLPVTSIHRQITSAIDLVVQLRRMRGGSRKICQVSEVVGVDERTGEVQIRDLFLLEGDDPSRPLRATGSLPSFMGDLIERGLIGLELFYR
jgi:pilus assembly protein CpaF